MRLPFATALPVWLLLATLVLPGCGGAKTVTGSASQTASSKTGDESADKSAPPKRKFQPVELGNSEGAAGSASATPAHSVESVVEALQPLKVMIGKWRGVTSKKFEGFNAVDDSDWVWDYKTDRTQPALVSESEKSKYIREARLTYLPKKQKYQLTLVPPEGERKVLEGNFTEDPADAIGDDDKPQRTYKLTLTQVAPQAEEAWQVVFNQRENNRYLVELSRKRGDAAFQRVDTIGEQREGTSFALNDEDYGDKKCIISGGLGTISVSHKGKTYWVCCTGCKAAFEDEPDRWLAKLMDKDKP